MNPVDAVVNFFAPESGHARIKSRMATAALMNYDAASKGRRTYGWKAPGTSADSAAYGVRPQLRQLSRELIRNRALAHRAQTVVTGSVVGTGIVPSAKVNGGSAKAKLDIEAALNAHINTTAIDALGEHTLFGLQRIAMNAVFSDGEVLVRRRMRDPRFSAGLILPLQIELVECDWLNTTVMTNGENKVIEGAEYGPTGAIEAYHFWDRHPGDVTAMGQNKSTRWPASSVIHVRRCDRPGQLRGVPWLAPVMMTLGEISDYQEAQILKQRMAALLAGVITPGPDGALPDTGALSDLAPGALVSVPEGSQVNWTHPPKVDGYGEFMKQAEAKIAVGVGITYESLSGDLSMVNFSSAQMGHMVMDRNVAIWQDMMIEQFCSGVERWLLEAWALVASLPRRQFSLEWTAPRRPLINPRNDLPAMVEEIDAGLTSRQRQQRQLGYDPETIRRERQEDMAADQAAGLPPIQSKNAAVAVPDKEQTP